MSKTIILASKSLWRKLLLEEAGFEVLINPAKRMKSTKKKASRKASDYWQCASCFFGDQPHNPSVHRQ